MPDVHIDEPSKVDKIHIRRMLHAFYGLSLRLRLLEIPMVDALLDYYDISILSGKRVGIDYGPGVPQILEQELKDAKVIKLETKKRRPYKKRKLPVKK